MTAALSIHHPASFQEVCGMAFQFWFVFLQKLQFQLEDKEC